MILKLKETIELKIRKRVRALVTSSPKGIDRHKDGSLTLSSQKGDKNEHKKRNEPTEIWGSHRVERLGKKGMSVF